MNNSTSYKEHTEVLHQMGRIVNGVLNGGIDARYGWVAAVTEFNKQGSVDYVSNIEREGAINLISSLLFHMMKPEDEPEEIYRARQKFDCFFFEELVPKMLKRVEELEEKLNAKV